MPIIENALEIFALAFDWIGVVANDIVIGLIVAVALMLWIWKGRDNNPRHA